MRTARRGLVMAVASVSLALIACGGGDSSSPSGLVQVAKYTLSPGTVTCGTQAVSPDTAILQVEMVNTTGADASVTAVGSFGTVIRSTTDAFVGTAAVMFDALPFTPQPTLLAAHTGDVTLRVALPTASLCSTNALPFADDSKDVQVAARVSTGSGQYVTTPAILHVFFPHL